MIWPMKGAVILMTAVAGVAGCGAREDLPETLACEAGSYQMEDGRVMGLAPLGGDLRYAFLTGEAGVAHEIADGVYSTAADAPGGDAKLFLGACADQTVTFWDPSGARISGARLQTIVSETRFQGVDGERAGRLVLPPGGEAKAIVVSVHGSERSSGRTGERLQTLLPAFGIGVFAYDKRGVGGSEGKYTQDFEILAGDAVAAAQEARRLYGRSVPVGYLGGSQGAWVAPLAAVRGGADFVIAAFGMAESPLAEDREEVMQDLRKAGYGDDVLAQALEATEATGRVMASDFKDGFEELAAIKRKYKDAAWLEHAGGEFTGDFLSTPNWLIRIIGPLLDVGTSWDYDPRPTLEAIDVPHLWILAGDDTIAPNARTQEILKDIQRSKPNLDVVLFPNTEHGIYEYVENAQGDRRPVRFAPGFFPLVRDFILHGEPPEAVAGAEIFRGNEPAAIAADAPQSAPAQ